MHVAIIGAGIAGLSCAGVLAEAGHKVSLFDKGRGPGGRMSTRRVFTAMGQAHFDHGAPCFSARDARFAHAVRAWSARGLVAPWPEAGDDMWVGVPGMNVLVRDMGSRHNVEFGFLVRGMVRQNDMWQVAGENVTRRGFDAVVVAVPAEQVASLVTLHDFAMARTAFLARSQPCWTAMFAFDAPVATDRNLFQNVGNLAWACRNNAKPGRGPMECWVVQADVHWSSDHIESTSDMVSHALRAMLEQCVGAPLPTIVHADAHRWRYARPARGAHGVLWNGQIGLGICGDWVSGGDVESAWVSGYELATDMISGAVSLRPRDRVMELGHHSRRSSSRM